MDLTTAEPLETLTTPPALVAALRQALGADRVQTDPDDRRFFSQDVFRAGALPMAVVQPQSVEEVQRCAELCNSAGAPMIPRGGGLSYTDGYLYFGEGAVLFDLRGLNRIVTIAAEDMYVTVEAGCTWEALDRALAPFGLRTPYWGPISGLQATVGGALSQNSAFWGAARHGVATNHVLGLDVVLADGTLLGVGAHGGKAEAPTFFRQYGPELTGLFTADCGAMGLKVRATLPLIKRLPIKAAVSFGFDTPEATLGALGELGRSQLVSEASMFDQGHQKARVSAAKIPWRRLVQSFFDVLKSQGPIAALQMARHGQKFLEEVNYSLHLLLEAPTKSELKRQLAEVRKIAAQQGAWPVAPTIGQVLSARPFPPPGVYISAARFLPINAIVPHSVAARAYRAVMDIFETHRSSLERLDVRPGIFSIAVGAGSVLIEPTFHWDAPFLDTHAKLFNVGPNDLPTVAANPGAEELVLQVWRDIAEQFLSLGAAHLQIGRTYPFKRSRNAENWGLLSDFKALVDPKGLMNPGVLGFEP
jgi:FAD/FMN-containing dehydrogenase